MDFLLWVHGVIAGIPHRYAARAQTVARRSEISARRDRVFTERARTG
jgi:hypothetical protein